MGGGPFHAGEHAGERPGKARDRIGGDRRAEPGEAARIAIGVDHQARGLRRGAFDDAFENRPAAEQTQAFVAAAHAPRLAAGEQDADDRPDRRRVSAIAQAASSDPARDPAPSRSLFGSASKTMRSSPASATKR